MNPTWYRLIRRHADNEAYLVTDRRQLEVVRSRAAALTPRNAMLLRLEVNKLASGAWGWEWIVEGKSAVLAAGRTWVSEADAEKQARLKDLRGLVAWPVEESEVVR